MSWENRISFEPWLVDVPQCSKKNLCFFFSDLISVFNSQRVVGQWYYTNMLYSLHYSIVYNLVIIILMSYDILKFDLDKSSEVVNDFENGVSAARSKTRFCSSPFVKSWPWRTCRKHNISIIFRQNLK